MADTIVKDRVDWGEVLRQRYLQNAARKDKKECSMLWQDRKYARRYDDDVRVHNWRKGKRLLRGLNVTAQSSILDIGACPGTLTIPAASLVGHVTAVEPADGMMWYLRKNVREQGLDNVTCIRKK